MQPKNGMATKKEIEELLTFIGGFEKWPLLNEDCQLEVVNYLDYKSRFNLGICSKTDQDTVEKTRINVESVMIRDTEKLPHQINKEEFDNVYVRIQFFSGNPIALFFSQLEQDTRVKWFHHIPKQRSVFKEVIWKSCNYYEEAVKFAEKWMKKSNFEVEAIIVGMANYPFAISEIKSLPCCKEVRICADDVESFDWWLKKCPEKLDILQLGCHSRNRESLALPSGSLNVPQVMQASQLFLWCRSAFSDEQLLNLNAKSISFNCVDVTDIGINQFLKNWVNGTGANGFEKFQLWETGNRNSEVMVAGLGAEEWNEAFGNEHWAFVKDFKRRCGRGQCYQIKSKVDPYESLTLGVHEDRVSIHATGKRAEHNGEAYTCYRVP